MRTRGRPAATLLAGGAVLAVLGVLALGMGQSGVGMVSVARHLSEVVLGQGSGVLSPIQEAIVWDLRLPRVLTALGVGAGLGLCGVVMQTLTRNQLAEPYLLGLSAGASLGAVTVIFLAGLAWLAPAAAFVGALVALLIALALSSGRVGQFHHRIVLAGIAVSQFFAAATSMVVFWTATGDSYREVLSWLLGSLASSSWSSVWVAWGGTALVGVLVLGQARKLDAFAFGDVGAASLGVRVRRTRVLVLGGVALLTGLLVSVSGAIGFVGLVIPHVAKALSTSLHADTLPLSALLGGGFLLVSDTVARTVFDPREIPVGIVTALIGVPAFVLLMRRSGGRT